MNTGWLKDKFDPKDFPRKPYRYGAAQVPDAVDLSALLASRLDQDGMNGCVGAALRTAIDATLISQRAYKEDQSWIWPWNGARAMEGTLSQNVGVYPRDAFDWLLKSGCLNYQYWPFTGKFDASAPSSEQMAQAVKYQDFAYYRVGDGAQGIMESLAESQENIKAGGPGWLVCIGSPWPDKWGRAPGGILADITAEDITDVGGHEYIIYGYNRAGQIFSIANSWGTDWGKNGCAELPYKALAVFKGAGGYDAQYLRFLARPAPVQTGCLPGSGLMNLFKWR